MKAKTDQNQLTFGGHLEVFRKMLIRIVAVVVVLAIVVFCFKDEVFSLVLAPHEYDFITFRWIEKIMACFGRDFHFDEYHIPLINTELSAQFMTHITVSCIVAALLASPFILFEIYRFVAPALYDNERRYSYIVAAIIYLLFIIGLAMSYFILFPISFQFLATYQVSEQVVNTITLDSYITTFSTLAFMMGIVFQMPVLSFILGKMGLLTADTLRSLRPYAFIGIMIIAAIITPPDIFTLILLTIPIYALYELCIAILPKG